MTSELGDTIFERELDWVDAEGNKKTIKLKIGMPYEVADTDGDLKWRCAYQIVGRGLETVKLARGMDAIDAMLTAIQLAYIFLKSYQKDQITWLGDEELGLRLRSMKELNQDSERYRSEDENSPFKKAFDDFFKNFKSGREPNK